MDDQTQQIVKSLTSFEFTPAISVKEAELTSYEKIPLTSISALGSGYAAFAASFANPIIQNGTGEILYRAVNAAGSPISLQYACKNGVGLSSGIMNGGKIGAAHFVPTSGAASMTTMLNPAMLAMSIMLVSIEKQLVQIQQTQEDILEFLVMDKRSKLQGDLNLLSEILNNYKYNWDNALYKSNMHMKVQDIKQEAEQNIIFYQGNIGKKLNERDIISTDQATNERTKKLKSFFEDYQLSLYLYGFSSFIEVMLLENFDAEYLNKIADGVEIRSQRYRELYSDCYNKLNNDASTSLQNMLLKGTAKVSKKVGNFVAKTPFISKSQIDENLLLASDNLKSKTENHGQKIVERFTAIKDSKVFPFVESIKTVSLLYNQPDDLLFDDSNVYIKRIG